MKIGGRYHRSWRDATYVVGETIDRQGGEGAKKRGAAGGKGSVDRNSC
jgi:hypothetical protein